MTSHELRDRALGLLLSCFLPVMGAAQPAAPPANPVAAASDQLAARRYFDAVMILDEYLRSPQLRAEDRVRARVALGVALVAMDQVDAARERFKEALALDPGARIDPSFVEGATPDVARMAADTMYAAGVGLPARSAPATIPLS